MAASRRVQLRRNETLIDATRSEMMMQPAILAQKISKSFAGVPAVREVSLAVLPGQVYGLMGPDGAGKTTVMRLLVGALRLDGGRASIAGHDLVAAVDRAREQLGYMPQRFSLYDDLTVAENLAFFAEVHGPGPAPGQGPGPAPGQGPGLAPGVDPGRKPRRGLRRRSAGDWKPRTREILDFVGLAEFAGRRADQLSGGMKKKLALATALVHRPRVLLLDEPTGGVDPVTRQGFWQLILRLAGEEGLAVLVSTPYMDEAVRCSRVGFLLDGRLLVEGTPQQLAGRLKGRVLEVIGRPRPLLRAAAAADPDVEDVQFFGDRLHIRVRPGATRATLERLPAALRAAGAEVEELRPVAPSLEDAFIEFLELPHPTTTVVDDPQESRNAP